MSNELRIDVHVHQDNAQLTRIEDLLRLILRGEIIMSQELDTLSAQVSKNTEVEASAVLLLQGLSSQIAALKNDPVALAALAASLNSSATSLSEAITANTPAA